MADDRQPVQRSLFEYFPNPVARNTDPSTSHQAETFINRTGKRAHQCRLVLAAVTQTEGLTASELSERHGIDHHAVHKRLPDLREKLLVENRGKRRCGVTGRPAMTWYLRVSS